MGPGSRGACHRAGRKAGSVGLAGDDFDLRADDHALIAAQIKHALHFFVLSVEEC
jgi:hypothetical protein